MCPETYYNNKNRLSEKYHTNCITKNFLDFNIQFEEDGTLTGYFFAKEKYQGYNGKLHGGVLSWLLDSLMTQCLFGHGIKAVTGKLDIRYRKPIDVNTHLNISVNIESEKRKKYYTLNAIVYEEKTRKAEADAVFVKQNNT